MNHYRNLVNFIDELISLQAKFDGDVYNLDINSLDEDDQGKLVALKLEESDRDTSECVHGLDFTLDNDYSCALLNMLSQNTEESRENFSRLVSRNTFLYFRKSLQSLIDERCNDYLHEERNSNGYRAQIDRNHGDIVWRKLA